MGSQAIPRTKSLSPLRLTTALLVLGLASAAYGAPPGMARGAPAAVVPLLLDGSRFEGLQEADPAAGINLVEAPEANNQGDARLSFPLEFPPGRLGMQPRLEVAYSSGAGNGWVGLGWSLDVPTISIDTRWGVPRYSPTHETETYLLEGQQLTPLAHRDEPVARAAGDRLFHTRVEGAFAKIVRHGAGPDDCWWEVTDTAGTVSSYGGRLAAGGLEAAAVLTDDPVGNSGNVFVWALREIRDTHGNTVLFDYERVQSTGLAQGTEPGHDLYLRSVRYTGHRGEAGPYEITFQRDGAGQAPRPDAVIDAIGGFKRVTDQLLRRVEVAFEDPLTRERNVIRSYEFAYAAGAFEKSLLRSITQRGPDGAEFHTHAFSYYDDVRTGGAYEGFGRGYVWDTGDDGLGAPLRGQVSTGAVSSGISDEAGGSVYGGFNPASPDKTGSGGVSVGYRWSDSEGLLELVDIDGDNLPDKVFGDGGGVFFRPNTSGPRSDPAAVTFGSRAGLPGLRTIAEERSDTFCFGPELHFGAQVLNSNAWTWSNQSAYLSDANGDGLADLVDAGAGLVQFNYRGPGGSPAFSPDSNLTPVPVVSGTVDTDGVLGEYRSCQHSMRYCRTDADCPDPFKDGPCVPLGQVLIDTYPLLDTVRRWVAPWDGRVAISGDAALAGGAGCDRYAAADGVRVAIQLNGEELWSARIMPGDGPASPRDVGSLQVRAGDRIYFRAQSVENGACDEVDWDPVIVYRNGRTPVDANLLDPYRYSASGDFVLAGRRGARVWMPASGTVRLDGRYGKSGATSDDVVVQVYHGAKGDDVGTLLLAQPVAWDEQVDLAPTLDIDVGEGDWVLLRVQVDSPIDLTRISWQPRLFYVSSPDLGAVIDENGEYTAQLNPPYDIDAYPFDALDAPREPWVAPHDGTVTATTSIPSLFPDPFDPCSDGEVVFTVKRPGELVAKRVVTVEDCLARNGSVTFAVTKGDALFFDYSVFSPELSEEFPSGAYAVAVTYDPDSVHPPVPGRLNFSVGGIVRRSANPELLFALPYRGWSFFGYNGNRERAGRPIDEAELFAYNARDYASAPYVDLRKEDAHPFMPRPAVSAWLGPDDRTWANARTMSASRLGSDDIRVPDSGDLALGPAVSRQSRSFQSVLGVGFLVAASSWTLDAWSAGEVDYLDMNGDLFPDVVSGGHIQYTSPRGGLEAARRAVDGLAGDDVRETDISSWNFGLGANAVYSRGDAQGKAGASSGQGAKNRSGKSTGKPSKGDANGGQKESLGIGFGFEFGTGDFDVAYDLADVNGDGLPDRVMVSGGLLQVALNLGYRFGGFEPWGEGAVGASSSSETSLAPGLGFNTGDFEFAGGVSFSDVSAEGEEELLDINGDGLADRVLAAGDQVLVGLNTGRGFTPPVVWSAGPGVTSSAVGLGGGAYFTIPIGPLCLAGCYIIINPGGEGGQSITRQLSDLRDVDGDGCADRVETDRDDRLTVSLNRTGRTNLLAGVARPLGGAISVEYRRDGNTYEMPESRWVLSRVTVDDGHPGDGIDRQTTAFAYAGGRSDRWEREFYGYGTVSASLLDAAGKPYRVVTRTYDNAGFYSRGLLLGEVTGDGEGRNYLETRHTWLLRDIETGAELADPGDDLATVFPELRRTELLFYEGAGEPARITGVLYEYELQEGIPGVRWSNLVRILDLGDEGPKDDLQLDIGYFADVAAYIVGKPSSLRDSSQGRELRRRELTLADRTGDVKQVRDYLADGTAAVTDYEHDAYGNPTKATFPPNHRGQRYSVDYGYDDRVHTHLARVEDVTGHVSTARHDLRFGKPLEEKDINGNSIKLEYDALGRVVSVTGPYELGTGKETVRYVYHHGAAAPWAMARQVDRFDAGGDPIDNVFFVDGFGRVTQTKRDASVHQGGAVAAASVMVVSGASEYDFAGRTVTQRHPVTEPTGTPGVPNAQVDDVEPTRMTYDVLDRLTSVTLPDSGVTRYEFGFGRDRRGVEQLMTRATDARGVPREILRDVRGLVVAVREFDGGEAHPIWTTYDYDPLRRLTAVVDDRGNAVEVSYDNLGRRVGLSSPDGGLTETRYDLDSNVVERVTANLRLSGGSILHDYEYRKLRAISYPAFPGNDATFTWGAPGAPGNGAGRVTRIADESGVESFAYGPLGEVAERTRTVASDTLGRSPNSPEVYVTRLSRDTWGRVGLLTYPDGEVVTHRYDSGGLLRELSGLKGEHRYSYVRRLEHDKFLDRAYVVYGNGVATRYGYNPMNRCLELLQSGPGPGRGGLFQDLRMTCDGVGNITRVRNLAAVGSPRWMGGATDSSFTYDDLNRLTGAEGFFQRPRSKGERFELDVEYDSIHNIVAMRRLHQTLQPRGRAVTRRETSFDLRYSYSGSGVHAPDRIGREKLEWDANGNQVFSRAPGGDGRRTLVWDEENRLQAISLNGETIRYKYDAAGERVVARGPQGETAYVNRHLTVRDREIGLKHFFAGETRIATKLMKQDRPGTDANGRMPPEKDLYFYHGDHLGTTTFVTDARGELFEHREYYPAGGIFVDESSNTRRAPYLYAAKELDEESGLYYFGFRYYDPEAALWLSADPTLEISFPGGGGEGPPPAGGGVFESRNLNLHGYAGQNPVTNLGSDAPPFSRPPLSGATLLASPQVVGIPTPVGTRLAAYPQVESVWEAVGTGGVQVSGSAGPAPMRWGVSQLTQDQAQSVEEAPATGVFQFDWIKIELGKKAKPDKKAPAAGEVGAAGGARKRALSASAPAPVRGDAADADLDVAPRRRRATSAP